ncbi:TIGR02300 family protein [Ancylobacter pratisalsi]|uniref:TIGR02300 family protein n=1 Tax=Ancylobacter pratisalsi TaxID=1745854 RepID=A0A6P1YLY5_9HYPH|nr:TIGR02300 family protein [Ancylobacter pratisalsi]QIB33980.1 TIGR02300 family protein [Ancylobacter pratisalsi]
MVKSDLGTKRVCPVTGRKFYDLNKDPVISPYTGQVVPIAVPVARGGSRSEAPRAAEPESEAEETADVELVSLEEADEEATTTSAKPVATDDDLEIEDDVESDDDDTFLEEDEDADDDVTDLIGDGIEDDEES